MATSKLPVDEVMVPASLLEFANKQPTQVFCNLRVSQRPETIALEGLSQRERYMAERRLGWDGSDRIFVHEPVRSFLKGLALPTTVVICFQGYGEETGTAVVRLEHILWTDEIEEYPRLDFVHPAEMRRLHGCPNFWGAFILAIAETKGGAVGFCEEDPGGQKFMEICTVKV